jgi:hypothetical protein
MSRDAVCRAVCVRVCACVAAQLAVMPTQWVPSQSGLQSRFDAGGQLSRAEEPAAAGGAVSVGASAGWTVVSMVLAPIPASKPYRRSVAHWDTGVSGVNHVDALGVTSPVPLFRYVPEFREHTGKLPAQSVHPGDVLVEVRGRVFVTAAHRALLQLQ